MRKVLGAICAIAIIALLCGNVSAGNGVVVRAQAACQNNCQQPIFVDPVPVQVQAQAVAQPYAIVQSAAVQQYYVQPAAAQAQAVVQRVVVQPAAVVQKNVVVQQAAVAQKNVVVQQAVQTYAVPTVANVQVATVRSAQVNVASASGAGNVNVRVNNGLLGRARPATVVRVR
jgi:hypothetical protein